MTDAATQNPADRERVLSALMRVFVNRYHSLAHYILGAGPFVAAGEETLLRRIEEIAAWDAAEAERLSDAIEGQEGIPQVQPFAPEVAELNYLALRHQAGVLVQALEAERETCLGLLRQTRSCLPAHRALRRVCDALTRHAAALRSDLASATKTA
jgi:hypothetical protein